MSREKDLFKNTVVITFGRICTQLIAFLLLPLYTAILTTSEYGTVDLIMTYCSLCLPFITLALEQAVFRFLIDIRNSERKSGEYITTTVLISLCLSSFVFIISCIIAFFFGNILFCLFGAALFACTVSTVALQICRGLGDNFGYALGSSITAIGQVSCNVLFLVVLRLGVIGMMFAAIAGNILCGIIIYFRCGLKKYLKINYFRKNIFKELSAYSLPLIPNQLSWWALNASDKIIVQFFIGVAGNGLIAVANKFSSFFIQFSNIFNISWTESVALHIYDKDAEQFICKTINSVFRIFLCTCCGVIVCMPFVFPIMINSQYREAYGLIPIFMLASLFNVVVSLYGVIYVAYKKTVEIAKTAVYAALLNIISHLILINFVGIYAAALSTMIGYGGMSIYRYFHSRRYIVIQFNNSTLISSVIMILLSFISYFCANRIFQVIALIIVAIFSLVLNKDTICTINEIIIKKMRKNRQ